MLTERCQRRNDCVAGVSGLQGTPPASVPITHSHVTEFILEKQDKEKEKLPLSRPVMKRKIKGRPRSCCRGSA